MAKLAVGLAIKKLTLENFNEGIAMALPEALQDQEPVRDFRNAASRAEGSVEDGEGAAGRGPTSLGTRSSPCRPSSTSRSGASSPWG